MNLIVFMIGHPSQTSKDFVNHALKYTNVNCLKILYANFFDKKKGMCRYPGQTAPERRIRSMSILFVIPLNIFVV